MLPRTPQKKATWHYPFYLYLGYVPQFGRFISSQNSNYSSLPNFKSNVQRRNPAQTMLIVQNRANNSSSVSRITRFTFALEKMSYGYSWYTRHGNQLRWLSVCVCVILSYDWTNGLKWQLATMCCNNNDHHRAPHYLCPKGRNVKLCDWSVW